MTTNLRGIGDYNGKDSKHAHARFKIPDLCRVRFYNAGCTYIKFELISLCFKQDYATMQFELLT